MGRVPCFSEVGNKALSNSGKDDRPRSRLDWDDLRIFAVVADCKSVNKAATALKVTPGAVSRRIDDLEQRLDVKLFTRTASGMTLTAAGEDVRDRALSMQRFADAIEQSVRGRDRKEEGAVTIAVPDGLAAYWIAPRLPQFLNENPKIQVTLDCGSLAKDLDIEPDISITAEKTQARVGDTISPLAMLHYLFLASPRYLETYGTPNSVASAAGDHRTLRHVAQTYQRETWGRRASAIEALASFSVVSNSSSAIMTALLAGAGIATAPSYFCHLYPELAIVGQESAIPIQLWMVNHQEAQAAARVQRVTRWLRGIFDTKTNPWFRDEYVSPIRFSEELAAIKSRLAPAEPAHKRGGA